MASARRAKHLSLARVASVAGTSANIGVNGCESLAQAAYSADEVVLVAWAPVTDDGHSKKCCPTWTGGSGRHDIGNSEISTSECS